MKLSRPGQGSPVEEASWIPPMGSCFAPSGAVLSAAVASSRFLRTENPMASYLPGDRQAACGAEPNLEFRSPRVGVYRY